MPTDLFDLAGQSKTPVKKNYLIASNILLVIAVLSFVLMLGGCFSCWNASKTTYDSEETPYRKPDGTIGYGAKSHTKAGDPGITIISGGVFFFSLMAGAIVRALGEKK